MGTADAPSFAHSMKIGTRISILLLIILAGFLLFIFIGIDLVNDVGIGGKYHAETRRVRDSLESALLVESGIRKLRTEEEALPEVTGTTETAGKLAVMRGLGSGIESGFAVLSDRTAGEEQLAPIVAECRSKWGEYWRVLSNETVPAIRNGDRQRAETLTGGIQKTMYGSLSASVENMVKAVKKQIDSRESNAASASKKKLLIAIVLSAAVILLVLVTAWAILRGIKRPLLREAEYARAMADGNLAGELVVDAGAEMGGLAGSLNAVAGNFRSLLGVTRTVLKELNRISRTISETSARIVKASDNKAKRIGDTSAAVLEINASVKGVAQGVDSLSLSASENSSSILEMAASVEEVALNVENLVQIVEDVSSSIVEMAASIKQISGSVSSLIDTSSVTASSVMEMDSAIRQVEKNAMDTSAISEEVRRDAEIGRSSVEATIKGMQEIRRSSGITSEVIVTLSEKANDIGTILSVIDEVAEQTNLLALNAAIIAAQAGEQGKGFAVVADEIKELADRTSSSTREIAMLIKGVQEETRRAVEAISHAEKSIAEGERLSQKSGEALNKIVEGVKRATEQVGEIAQAAAEQAKGSQMIRDAVEQVTDMIQQISNATQEQNKGSELIMTAVERMKLLTGQVRSSTREQSKVGSFIARSTENITTMIQQIKRACDEQSKGSEQIVYAIEDIQRSTDENMEAVSALDDAFTGLARQIEALDTEVRRFRTDA